MNDLHVTAWGAGEPAVLVHGSFHGGEETFEAQRPLAEQGFRLLLPDRRGHGRSPEVELIDFERDTADVVEVVGGGAHLVGYSYGGVVPCSPRRRRRSASARWPCSSRRRSRWRAGTPRSRRRSR